MGRGFARRDAFTSFDFTPRDVSTLHADRSTSLRSLRTSIEFRAACRAWRRHAVMHLLQFFGQQTKPLSGIGFRE